MTHHFELEDAPGYLARFPLLAGKAPIARGEYSIVYEGTRPETILKLTVDSISADFATSFGQQSGLCRVVENHGAMACNDHGEAHLLEMDKLVEIDWDKHRAMWFERDTVMAAVRYRVAASESNNGSTTCQICHANAMEELSLCTMFSETIRSAFKTISEYLRTTSHDVLLDLCNPSNYMTDGISLIVTDPIIPVH